MREKLSSKDISYIAMGTALLCVCSWLCIPLTVPVTMQSFAVCLVAVLLGVRGALWTVTLYILLGAVGLPVFAGFHGGFGALLGATGGYIFGFLPTALTVGFVSQRWHNKTAALAIAMALGVVLCYACGTVWFALVYAQGGTGFLTVLSLYVIPYVIPDILKIALALVLARRLYYVVHK